MKDEQERNRIYSCENGACESYGQEYDVMFVGSRLVTPEECPDCGEKGKPREWKDER